MKGYVVQSGMRGPTTEHLHPDYVLDFKIISSFLFLFRPVFRLIEKLHIQISDQEQTIASLEKTVGTLHRSAEDGNSLNTKLRKELSKKEAEVSALTLSNERQKDSQITSLETTITRLHSQVLRARRLRK